MISTIIKHDALFTKDDAGNLRQWWMETEAEKFRSVTKNHLGTETRSGWKIAKAKNTGRSNATTAEEQALREVESVYKKKIDIEGYSYDPNDVGKKYFAPMLAEKWDLKNLGKKFNLPGFIQPKLDGLRGAAQQNGISSRAGKFFPGAMYVNNDLIEFFKAYPSAVLDGELYNHEFRDEFEKVVSLIKNNPKTDEERAEVARLVQYHVYDLPVLNLGEKPLPFSARYENLLELKRKGLLPDRIHVVETHWCNQLDFYDTYHGMWVEDGYEGSMFRQDVNYVNDRDWALIKRKDFIDDEFTIVDIEEGTGNWAGKAKRVIARLPNGDTTEAGMRGNFAFATQLLREKNQYVGGKVTIRFQNFTAKGKLRIGVALRFYKAGERRD